MTTTILASVAILAFSYVCKKQQDTINELTNKLMAKDYQEYRRMEKEPEGDLKKPRYISFFSNRNLNS